MDDLFDDFDAATTMGVPRSPQWAAVRAKHLEANRECICCGSRKNLNVHHVKPFHLFPDLELDPANLVTMTEGGPVNIHYLIGHCGLSWSCWNPDIPSAIAAFRSFVAEVRGYAVRGPGLRVHEFDVGGES